MKDYLNLFNNDYSEAKKELLKDLNESIRGAKVNSSKYGLGYIVAARDDVTNPAEEHDYQVEIDFSGATKTFCLMFAIKRGAITLEGTLLDLLKEYMSSFKAILEERSRQLKIEAEKQAEEHRKLEEFRAAQKAALEKLEKEKKEAEKFEKRKAEAIKKFSDLCRQAKMSKAPVDDEDFIIGWLAKHVTRISAEIPDFLERYFVAHFGANAPKTVVNTSMKSSGGFTKKWSLSCQVHVDDLATMPPALQTVFKKSKTANSTSFALKLIYDYGFNFGKEQDISQIKSMSSDPKAFDLGYSA